jgi:hypothetical protein
MVTRIGLDIGRVIIAPVGPDGRTDTSFLGGTDAAAMRTPPSEGAFEVIRELVEAHEGRVWLVSKCGPRIQARTRDWLRFQGFYRTTGMDPSHLRFCRKRPQKQIHARQLGLTHFVDDRLDVLRHLPEVTPNLYLFGVQKPGTAAPEWVTPVADWAAVRAALIDARGPEQARRPLSRRERVRQRRREALKAEG